MIIITAIRSQISDTTVVISHEMKDIARSKKKLKKNWVSMINLISSYVTNLTKY